MLWISRNRICKVILFCFLTLTVLFIAQEIFAAEKEIGNPDYVLEQVKKSLKGKQDKLLKYARALFMGLAMTSLCLGLMKHILSGESNVGSVFVILAKWIIFVSFFLWIMGGVGGLKPGPFIPGVIFNSFQKIGQDVAGAAVMPGDILKSGLKIYGTMMDAAREHGWVQTIIAGFSGVVLMIVFSMLATILTVALIEAYVVICGGSVLLGFAGLENTRDIAMGYIKYSVSIGVKVLIIMIIASTAKDLTSSWAAELGKLQLDVKGFFNAIGFLVGGSTTLMLAAYLVPNMAQSAVSGSSIGGSIGGAAAMYAAAAAGAWKGAKGAAAAPGKTVGGAVGGIKAIGRAPRRAASGVVSGISAVASAPKRAANAVQSGISQAKAVPQNTANALASAKNQIAQSFKTGQPPKKGTNGVSPPKDTPKDSGTKK